MNQNDLFMDEIQDRNQQLEILDQLVFREAEVEFFTPVGEKIMAHLRRPFLKEKAEIFYLELATPADLSPGSMCKIKMFGDNMVLGLSFEIVSISGTQITARWPHKFYKINRREALRYRLTEAWVVQTSAGAGLLYDLSVDGVGILMEQTSAIKPLQVITAKFVLNHQELEVQGQIRSIKPQGTRFHKLGIKIQRFIQGNQPQIANFINSRQSKYLKKVI